MFAFLHQLGLETILVGIIGEGLEIHIKPIERFALHLLVLHLEIDFAILTGDVKKS
jgi:hypothetical protein